MSAISGLNSISLDLSSFGDLNRQSGGGNRGNSGIARIGGANVAFGDDIARRAQISITAERKTQTDTTSSTAANTGTSSATNSDATNAAKAAPDDQAIGNLAKGLSSAIDYINQKYGEKAGTAVMGLIYQKLGNGPVTEDNLGDALIQGIKFIDRNFGISEGDSFMAELNDGGLNSSINDFFDNGSNERFMALTPDNTKQLHAELASTATQIKQQYGDEAASSMQSLFDVLNSAIDSGDTKSIKDNLKILDKKMVELKAKNNPNNQDPAQLQAQSTEIAPASSMLSATFKPEPGSTLDMMV